MTTRTLCSGNSPSGIVHACADREVITDTPVSILKSIKNPTEIKGMLEANIRSAICHARLLKWAEDNAGTGKVILLEISKGLELKGFEGISSSRTTSQRN